MPAPASLRPGPRPARLLAALLAALLTAGAQAISYTVQVVAVSDQDSALSVQRLLLNDAFPTYVVRASTAQGDIYRVRVGAFGNRMAAQLFAEAMPAVAGSRPLPALAEGIPAGVMPLEPRVVAAFGAQELEVLPWGESVAIRIQSDPARPATYQVLSAEQPWLFQAWRAAPVEGGVLRLRNLPLWPPTWEDDVPEAREAYQLALIESLATRLESKTAEVEQLQGRPVFGPPFLIVLELVEPGSTLEATLLGIAQPGDAAFGPEELVLGSGPMPEVTEPLYRAALNTAPEAEEFGGEAWRVTADDSFFLLSVDESGRGWRAGVGTPLWSDGTLLLIRAGEKLIFYDFVSR